MNTTAEYTCGCPGFRTLTLERMCVRCLDAYTDGLPYVLSGARLTSEMRRVAACLKKLVAEDPLLGEQRVYVPAAGREN